MSIQSTKLPVPGHKWVHPLDIHAGKARLNPGAIKGFNPQPEPPRMQSLKAK